MLSSSAQTPTNLREMEAFADKLKRRKITTKEFIEHVRGDLKGLQRTFDHQIHNALSERDKSESSDFKEFYGALGALFEEKYQEDGFKNFKMNDLRTEYGVDSGGIRVAVGYVEDCFLEINRVNGHTEGSGYVMSLGEQVLDVRRTQEALLQAGDTNAAEKLSVAAEELCEELNAKLGL